MGKPNSCQEGLPSGPRDFCLVLRQGQEGTQNVSKELARVREQPPPLHIHTAFQAPPLHWVTLQIPGVPECRLRG